MQLQQLIKEASQGSAAAQKCLFDELSGKLWPICLRYVKSREDAEEILLDCFFKVFKNLKDFKFINETAFHGWIKKILINECLAFLRKKNSFSIVSDSAAEEMALDEDMLQGLEREEIYRMILQLPTGYRTVFNLNIIDGLDHKEIASRLGINEASSRSQLSKARTLLQKMLLQKGIEYVKQRTK